MVRYKRYKRRYGGTRSVKMQFQSFMDINTSSSSMQIITINAGGKNILARLPAMFSAFKYYKIGNVSVKLVPASTLPVDPTGLSYEAGEQTVDPRDQLTPGMMRITNGEDIFEDITGLSDAEQHAIYNQMLLDPRWFKWMLQAGVKRNASPRYWMIGQLHQDKWPGAITNLPAVKADGSIDGTMHEIDFYRTTAAQIVESGGSYSDPRGFFQTGHTGRLGWLPTDGLSATLDVNSLGVHVPLMTSPPEVEVMKIILPKAYKTEYYYRLFITETVYFKEPILQNGVGQYRPLDVFHLQTIPGVLLPSDLNGQTISDSVTGGNYGDN